MRQKYVAELKIWRVFIDVLFLWLRPFLSFGRLLGFKC